MRLLHRSRETSVSIWPGFICCCGALYVSAIFSGGIAIGVRDVLSAPLANGKDLLCLSSTLSNLFSVIGGYIFWNPFWVVFKI